MVKIKLYICVLLPVFFLSCNKDEDVGSTPPELPEAVSFDLNQDGFDDVEFRFSSDDVVTNGTFPLVGYVYPQNGALLMVSQISTNSWILDGETNDIIRKGESPDFSWYPSNLGFMHIDDNPQGLWPNEWNLSSQKSDNPYYLGIQVKENENFLIGWLKLNINKKTAEITIVGSKVSQADSIIIDG